MTQPSRSSKLFLLIFSFALALSSFTLQAQDVPDHQQAPVVPTLSQFQLENVRVPIRADYSTPRISASPQGVSTTFTVTTTNDTGAGSFRKAINDANASSGRDIIEFNIPASGYITISPTSPLPYIVDPVVIDATTQSGYALMPLIEIDGINAGDTDGLTITAGNSVVKGIAVNRFAGYGIGLWIGGGNVVEGCFVGLGLDGVTDKGNGSTGIAVFSPNNRIGNPNAGPTVISGNGAFGIRITDTDLTGNRASGNKIQHCFIGTNASSNAAVPNDGSGIVIVNSADDTIGGPGYLNGNVIAGNAYDGIEIFGPQSHRIIIQGNRIGTNGSSAIPNGDNGILVSPYIAFMGTPSSILIGGNNLGAKNVISGNGGVGIAFFQDGTGGVGNVIIGNFIGTDTNGTVKVPNLLGGIFVEKFTDNNAGILIGGSTYSDSVNVISGNKQFGIWMHGLGVKNNFIRGNYIGTTKLSQFGISALGNQYAGIFLDNAPMNIIGGESSDDGNLIGSNGNEGIAIIGDSATGNSIQNNYIGTSAGDRDLGNQGHGIYIEASQTVVGAVNNTNAIAHNHKSGIFIFSGTKNSIRFNSIHDNDSLGIDLSPQGVTPNDRKDTDSGVNNLQNFPLLDSASLSVNSIHIKGRFDSEPNTQYTIDFFKNTKRNASRFGEGETYIGSVTVQCDTGGSKNLDVILPIHVYDDEFITATATDPQGNTSEFSRALCLQDSDGDGILDCWESEGDGIDVNADGIIDYNLWAKGARPNHKDIFVEVDWMEGFRPKASSMAMVVDAFKNVPNSYVNNPDGKPGINLVVEVSTDTLATSIWDLDPWPEFFDNKLLYFGTIGEREDANQKNILDAKRLVYRYCIFAHSFNPEGWSGIAEYNNGAGGNDFIVSLGRFTPSGGDKFQQAGTFMHEMGHTIGLHHGGIDDINYKPNYYSVMNYTWQFPKKDGSLSGLTWKLDYSPAALPTLVEDSLNEAAGLGPQLVDFPSPIFIPFSDTSGAVRTGVLYPNAAIDWDGDGDSSGLATVPVDINNLSNPRSPSPGETLEGFADWQNLKYNFRNSPTFLDPSPAELLKRVNAMKDFPKEMTPEIYEYIQSFPPYGIVPPVIIPSSLTWLGTFPGGYTSEAWGVSDDGIVVTGYATDLSQRTIAFRWTAANGMINLGTLGGKSSKATGISSDGNTIVGVADDSTNILRAFKWTEAAGMQDLGAGDNSRATSVSSNGTAITVNVYPNAYRWTLSGGLQNLGSLGGNRTDAYAVSSNGSVIVGFSYNASNDPYAFRWVENGGMTNIGIYYSFARGVSGDGNTVTGFETGSAGFYRAFRWTAPNGFEMNIVGNFSSGWDVSYDGMYIVGDGSGGAFRLSQSNELEFFNQTYSGLLTSGSEFYTATAISSNGRFVVGDGFNSSTKRYEAYLLDTGGGPVSIEDNEMEFNNFSLEQNYPNPFNPSTAIQFGLPYTSHVTLKIYNILGQEVATLLNENRDAGQHTVQWVARGLASGLYFYRIQARQIDGGQAGNFIETKKLLLLK